MTKEEVIAHWVESSDDDFRTMEHLMGTGDYAWALFIGHLVIEKLLKAYYVAQVDAIVPLTHNLAAIAQRSGLAVSAEQADLLGEITPFNISARYGDDKQSF